MASALLGALAHPLPSLGLKLLALPTGAHLETSVPSHLVPRPSQGSEELSRQCLSVLSTQRTPRGSSWRSVDRDFKGKINKAWTCLLLTSSRPVSMAAAPTVPPTLWDLGASSQPPSPSQAAFLPGFCWGSCSKMGSGRIR